MNSTAKLLDVVALRVDLPQYNLWRGQVGTVVEIFRKTLCYSKSEDMLRHKGSIVTALSQFLGCPYSKLIHTLIQQRQASYYLASDEVLAVKRLDLLVGFYIPVRADDEEVQRALIRLSKTVEAALAQSGWDEETLSRALDLSQKE